MAKTTGQGVIRTARGTFAPGCSGNAGGKPKLPGELKLRCLEAVNDHVIAAWIDELQVRKREVKTQIGPMDMRCRGDEWLKCSELLASYGLGRPTQHVEAKITDGMTDDDVKKAVIEMHRQLEQEAQLQ